MVNLRPPLSLEGRNIYHTHTSDPYCYIKPNLTGTVPVQGRQVLKSEEEESRILYTLKLQKGKVPFCLYSLPPFPPGGGGGGGGTGHGSNLSARQLEPKPTQPSDHLHAAGSITPLPTNIFTRK